MIFTNDSEKEFLSRTPTAIIVILFLAGSVTPQTKRKRAPPPSVPLTVQTATTKDGRTVLLKNDWTWEYTSDPAVEPSPTPTVARSPNTASLAIEAAIVYYNPGEVLPQARSDLRLLDQSLPQILREAGLHVGDLTKASPPSADTDENLLSDLVFATQHPTLADRKLLGQANAAIKQHTRFSGTTDFMGKLVLNDIWPGDYFVMSLAQTRNGAYAIWNLPVSIKRGSNSIILDQRNAAVAF